MSDEIRLEARGLSKRYGHVVAMDGADFELRAGEVLAVIGDNGAGKTTMIKALTGALIPDSGQIFLDGAPVKFRNPLDARKLGIETVYQELALAPGLDIATNLFMGRELRRPGPLGSVLRMLDKPRMRRQAADHMSELRIGLKSLSAPVESLSGGQRQGVAVARAAAWARHVVVMDEPTAALGVRESAQVLDLIGQVRDKGLAVVLISHNMPHVFEIADRIHVQRLGKRVALVNRQDYSMPEVVAIMTGALRLDEEAGEPEVVDAAAASAAGIDTS